MDIKRKIISFFKSRKVNVFLLFIVLASLFSILTKLSQDYTQSVTFAIEPTNVPEDKIIIKDSIQNLDITLTTYGFKLIRYYFYKPSVTIDIGKAERKENYFQWISHKEFSNVVSQFDPNVKIENINPDTLRLRYDTNSVKLVPVILSSNIEFAPGYDLSGNLSLQPDSVKVIGPRVLIDSVRSITTKQLNLKNVKSDISSPILLDLPNNDQLKFSNSQVNLNAEVERYTEGTISVPVIVKNIPEDVNLKIYPKSIEVIYYASLKEFKNIGSNSFIVECDYKDAKDDNASYLIPKITQQPSEVKRARLSITRIEFIISK